MASCEWRLWKRAFLGDLVLACPSGAWWKRTDRHGVLSSEHRDLIREGLGSVGDSEYQRNLNRPLPHVSRRV